MDTDGIAFITYAKIVDMPQAIRLFLGDSQIGGDVEKDEFLVVRLCTHLFTLEWLNASFTLR